MNRYCVVGLSALGHADFVGLIKIGDFTYLKIINPLENKTRKKYYFLQPMLIK